jgi:hypothetical protein
VQHKTNQPQLTPKHTLEVAFTPSFRPQQAMLALRPLSSKSGGGGQMNVPAGHAVAKPKAGGGMAISASLGALVSQVEG